MRATTSRRMYKILIPYCKLKDLAEGLILSCCGAVISRCFLGGSDKDMSVAHIFSGAGWGRIIHGGSGRREKYLTAPPHFSKDPD